MKPKKVDADSSRRAVRSSEHKRRKASIVRIVEKQQRKELLHVAETIQIACELKKTRSSNRCQESSQDEERRRKEKRIK